MIELLRAVIAAHVVVALILVATMFGHSAVLDLRARRRQPRIERATAALTRLLVAGGPIEDAVAATAALPVSAQSEVLGALAGNLRGEQRTPLIQVAERSGLVERARAWTRSRRPTVRLRGVRTLLRIGTPPPDLPSLLTDPWAPVRAEATRLVVAHPDPAAVAELVGRLADPAPEVAFAAKDALVRAGAVAEPAVSTRLSRSDLAPDVRAALLGIAVHVAAPSHGGLLDQHRPDPHPPVRIGVARLAAAIGTREAASALTALLDDGDEQVRAAAVEGLGAVGHWPVTPRIAELLGDPAWVVRQAAGTALRRLGAPGALYLRRALDDPDAFARDMARQVLDLPDLRSVG